jgi:hypothetical protein
LGARRTGAARRVQGQQPRPTDERSTTPIDFAVTWVSCDGAPGRITELRCPDNEGPVISRFRRVG